jgi:hypothetical protein
VKDHTLRIDQIEEALIRVVLGLLRPLTGLRRPVAKEARTKKCPEHDCKSRMKALHLSRAISNRCFYGIHVLPLKAVLTGFPLIP